MGSADFTEEMRRMARINGVAVDEAKMTQLLRADVDAGAEFINIFKHQKEVLIITSVAVHALVYGLVSARVLWSIPHGELESARAVRSAPKGADWDRLELDTATKSQEFTFGYNAPGAQTATKREMAKHNAEVAAAEINAILDRRSDARSVDPDLQAFHRHLEARRSGVPLGTESSEGWTRDDFQVLYMWMREAYIRGEYQVVWARRCALGYGMGENDATKTQWFWINALPAMAGLKLNLKDDLALATWAALASTSVDWSSDVQKQWMRGIEIGYHGHSGIRL
jgi:hypothetical protein